MGDHLLLQLFKGVIPPSVSSLEHFKNQQKVVFACAFLSLFSLLIVALAYGLSSGFEYSNVRLWNLSIYGLGVLTLFLSWGLSFRLKHPFVYAFPSLVFSVGALFFFADTDHYHFDHHSWVNAQIMAAAFAVLLATVRINIVVLLLNILGPLLLTRFLPHVDFVDVLQQQLVIYFLSPLAVYLSYLGAAERKTRQLMQRNSEVIRKTSDLGFWQMNILTNEVLYDERWCQMLGYGPDELGSEFSTFEGLIHPDDFEATVQRFNDYIENRVDTYEAKFRMRHKNGSWIVIITKGMLVARTPEGIPEICSGTHYDVTKFQKIMEEKAELSQLTHAIQEMTKIGGWSVDLGSREVYWTDEVYKIYGLEMGKSIDLDEAMSFYSPKDRPQLQKCFDECSTLGVSYDETFEFINVKGEKLNIRTRGDAIKDQQGAIYKVQGTFQDITEQVKLEKDFEAERAKLLHASKLATLGEMAAGVAHEINNPLAIISGSSRLIELKPQDTEALIKAAGRISRATIRIARIVTGLRKFSRYSDGYTFQECSLSAMILESVELSQSKCRMASVELRVGDIPDLNLRCDEVQVQQVLINLIANAADANQGMTGGWIEVSAKKNPSNVEIWVRDSGKGIPSHVVEKMFNPFFTTKSVGSGTGLGLSISKGIAKEHGGDLIYREVDGHTTIVFVIDTEAKS